jgi:choline dehydrogenase-like flavoprotein
MMRPTTGAAYTEWGLETPAVTPRVEPGAALRGRRRVRADACVIGTGAGGGAVAKELAEGGMDVVMLEAGDLHETDAFSARPRDMTPRLYEHAGQLATSGNVPILLPVGRGVGGTTVMNSGTCFRTPNAVLAEWRRDLGLDELTPDQLDPYFRRVERELNVSQVPPEVAGRNAAVVRRGAEALGWSGDFLFRAARGCVGSGVCAFGCPASAKQHIGITYVPRAWAAGATTWTRTRATRIDVEGGRARGVEARTAGGGRLRVDCDTVIVAAGALQTPMLLRRSRIGVRSWSLGRNLSIHPCTAVRALFDEEIDMAAGVPQSYYVDEFAADGIVLEGAAGPPDYLASALAPLAERHRDVMLRYRSVSQFGLMIRDTSRGSVHSALGRPFVRYRLDDADLSRVRRGIELLCELYRAAGAKRLFLPIAGLPELDPGDLDVLRAHDLRARDLVLMAFHPLGTARAHARADLGVVDADLRVHGAPGVLVADGSAVPTSLGANPQITIMALATRAAFRLLGRSSPEDEPFPETIAHLDLEAASCPS